MSLEGAVGEFGLVDIFQLIAMQKKSGVLTVSRKSKDTVRISFLDGAFVRAISGDENDRFSNAMISAEKITIAQLKTAGRITSKGDSIAETFMKLNYITPEEAMNWNGVLTQDVLFDLLSWGEGSYKFSQEAVSKMAHETSMNVESVIMEGTRQSDEWPSLLKKIPSRWEVYERVGTSGEGGGPMADSAMTFENNEFLDSRVPSESDDSSLLRYINGERTVNEVISHVCLGGFSAYKEFADLLTEGKIRACKRMGKNEKGVFSDISFGGIKKVALGHFLLNGLLVGTVMVMLLLFLRPIFLEEGKPLFQKIQGKSQRLSLLSVGNKKDLIAFSLSLYHLKHNRYPDALIELKKDGFLDQNIFLETSWAYSHDRSGFSLKYTDKTF